MVQDNALPALIRVISQATDPSLQSEDWSLLMDVCDRFNELKGGTALADASAAVLNRLNSTNPQSQLLALTLFRALVQNLKDDARAALCTTATVNVLRDIGTSPATKPNVRASLLSHLDDLAHEFSSDTRLRLLSPLAEQIRQTNARTYSGGGGDNRNEASDLDEESEQMRLAIEESLREANLGSGRAASIDPDTEVRMLSESTRRMSITSQMSRGTGTHSSNEVRAIYDYSANETGELSFRAGDVIRVLKQQYEEWWEGELHGARGIFPVNYVERIVSPSAQAAQLTGNSASSTAIYSSPGTNIPDDDESYVLAQARNVEKLLSIFAAASQQPGYSIVSNDDIQRMYAEVMALRPKLIQLIDEYADRKRRLLELNDQVAQARQSYERLVAARVAPSASTPFSPALLPRPAAPEPTFASHVPLQGSVSAEGYKLTESQQPQQSQQQQQLQKQQIQASQRYEPQAPAQMQLQIPNQPQHFGTPNLSQEHQPPLSQPSHDSYSMPMQPPQSSYQTHLSYPAHTTTRFPESGSHPPPAYIVDGPSEPQSYDSSHQSFDSTAQRLGNNLRHSSN